MPLDPTVPFQERLQIAQLLGEPVDDVDQGCAAAGIRLLKVEDDHTWFKGRDFFVSYSEHILDRIAGLLNVRGINTDWYSEWDEEFATFETKLMQIETPYKCVSHLGRVSKEMREIAKTTEPYKADKTLRTKTSIGFVRRIGVDGYHFDVSLVRLMVKAEEFYYLIISNGDIKPEKFSKRAVEKIRRSMIRNSKEIPFKEGLALHFLGD
ncbi:MAG: hypothetical protein WC919_01145 [Candidatus Paceibacterota bacterium]|jgi:hypothetical protein